MPLRILHFSDIHFQRHDDGWDEDADVHNEALLDVTRLVESEGAFDAIVIGGDIAFSASAAEYEKAGRWIDLMLTAAGGLERGQVRLVPGNHDISWSTVNRSSILKRFRKEVRKTPIESLDHLLRVRLEQDPAAHALFEPLNAYNAFAAGFGCPSTSKRPAWEDNSLVVDGWSVRLAGVNSVINSGPKDAKGVLVVGSQQCRMERETETIRLVMLHHPPTWLRDWAVIEGHMKRSHLILFGHEHAFDARQETPLGTVEVSAGALAPERDQNGEVEPYLPTYNSVTLARTPDDLLDIKIDTRQWDKVGTRFVARASQGFQVALEQPVLVHEARSMAVDEATSEEVEDVQVTDASPLVQTANDVPGELVSDQVAGERKALRNIGVAFLQLPALSRLEIGRRLGVLSDLDAEVPLSEVGGIILERVGALNLVDALKQEMGL